LGEVIVLRLIPATMPLGLVRALPFVVAPPPDRGGSLNENAEIDEVDELGTARVDAVKDDHFRRLTGYDVLRKPGPGRDRVGGEVKRMPGRLPACASGSKASPRSRCQSMARLAFWAAVHASHSAPVMCDAKKSSVWTTLAPSCTVSKAASVDFPTPLAPSRATTNGPGWSTSLLRIAVMMCSAASRVPLSTPTANSAQLPTPRGWGYARQRQDRTLVAD
jgi:hypothetical protein